MKKLIIETFIKGVVFSLGIVFTILGVYGVNSLVNIKSVDTTTVLTSNLWNETMSSLTGAINTLGNEVVKLTGDQTISGKKTFSTQVAGVTPVAGTDLVTKDYVDTYVDTKVQASSAGGTSWVTTTKICVYYYNNQANSYQGCNSAPSCETGWTDIGTDSYTQLYNRDSSGNLATFINRVRFCAKKM